MGPNHSAGAAVARNGLSDVEPLDDCSLPVAARLYRPATRKQLNQQNCDSEHEQNVDEPAERIGAHEAQQP